MGGIFEKLSPVAMVAKHGVSALSPAAMVAKKGPEVLSPAAMLAKKKRSGASASLLSPAATASKTLLE